MSETAEVQILAAAQRSLEEKSQQFGQVPARNLQKLVAELSSQLPGAGLSVLLTSLPGGEVLNLLKPLTGSELEQLDQALGACYSRLFPPAQQASQISRVQSLTLVDFDQEESDSDAEEGFSLLEFDGDSDVEADSPEQLRESLWLLMQLTAAWYYIHFGPGKKSQ